MKLLPSLLLAAAPAFTFGALFQEGQSQEGNGAPPAGSSTTGSADEDEAALPDRGGQGAAALDIFGRPTRARKNTLAARLIGGWRLTRMDLAGTTSVGRAAQGFLNIGESFMSLEIHAAYNQVSGGDAQPNDVHASFTAEYRLSDGGVMECATIIGSFLDDNTGELRWERTGFPRRYVIKQEAGQLVLVYGQEFGQLTQLHFSPQLPTAGAARDIFGARKGSGSFGAERDIFGSPISAGTGERDVFGREIAPTDPKNKKDGDEEKAPQPGRAGRGGSR